MAARTTSKPPPGNGRRGPTPTLSRDRILDAAEACFNAGGYDGLTIRAVAGRLGCAVGSLYRYFDDVHALLAACAERLFEPALRHVLAADGPLSSAAGRESVQRSIRLYIAEARRRPNLYQLAFWLANRDGEPGLPGPARELVERWAERLGSRPEAERTLAIVHGGVTCGMGQMRIETMLGGVPAESAAKREPVTRSRRESGASPPEPQIKVRAAVADAISIPSSPVASAPPDEDLTLL